MSKQSEQLNTSAPMTVGDLMAILKAQSDSNKEMLLEVLAEARRPVITDEQMKRIKQDLEDRKEMAATIMAKMANDKAFQEICTHMNSNSTTSAVLVQPSNFAPYFLCQHCLKRVTQDKEPRLFAILMQASGGSVGNLFA